MLQMADQSAANDPTGRSEIPQLRVYVDSFPVGASIELDLGAKDASNQKAQKKRKKACMDRNFTFKDKLAFIKECQHELDGLFEFYKELYSCKLHLEDGHFNSMNSAVACMLEESSLSFSSLVEEVYGKMKAKEGYPGGTLASIRSAVLFVGQRVMYGVVNEDVDVLEDVSENCLWCWETRDMKLLPKTQRGFLSVRRMGRKKIHERISVLSMTISSLSRLGDENHHSDLIKASQRLQKALNLSEIHLLVEKLKQKSNADMAEKEAKLKEKELIKELERNKHIAEMERKRIDQENQRKQQQAEKELKRIQEEAVTEEKRLEKERAELKKQLKKQEMQAKKDQQRHEKETAELKKQLKIQKQATIMERFLKRTKVNDSFDLTYSQEALISEATCKGESMVHSASLLMDHALLLHESSALDDLRRLLIVRWHKCRHSNRSNRWGVRSKPKINLFQGLKLLGQSSETGPFDKFSFSDKDLTDKRPRYSSEAVLDKQLSECADAVTNHNKCHDSVENITANCLVKKLLQFDKSNRPAYYGTWSKKSIVGPRNPFKKDPDLDYEVDSEEEWEEEEPGESLSDCERDKEDEVLDEENMKEGSDDESEDSFLVPDGYLSENEGVQVEKSSDSMDGDSRNLTGTQMETENESFRTFFQQQKYLNNLTEQALRKCHPLIITNLMHEKSALLISDTIDGTARLEQICLQVLCMRPCPGGSAIEVSSDHLVSKDQEQQSSPANNISSSPAPAVVIPDTELPEFVRAIQSSPHSINKVVESLQLKFSSIPKSQIKNKVREISDFSDHRWQVKKEVLGRLGLSISTNKSNNKEKGIAKFFSKRCLPPRDLPLKFPESSPEQPSKTPLIQSEKDRSTTA